MNMKNRTLLIITAALAVFSIILAGRAYAQSRPVEVETVVAQKADIINSIVASGVIEDASEQKVFSDTSGVIAELYVSEGSYVVKGQALMLVNAVAGGTFNIPEIDESILEAASYFGISGVDSISGSTYGSFNTTGESFYIAAPCDGIVTSISGGRGNLISTNSACAAVSPMDELYVRANISESNISELMTGMSVSLTGDAFPGRTYQGVLKQIMPTAKQTSSLTGSGETVIETLIYIKAPDEYLRPGYTASVIIYTTKKSNTITVPYETIFQDEDNNQVVLVAEGEECYPRVVETGVELEDVTEITGGLTAGETIVFAPDPALYGGGRIK